MKSKISEEKSKSAEPQFATKLLKRYSFPEAVLGLDVTPDGQQLLAACMDGVYQLDVSTEKIDRLYRHRSYASGVVHIPDTEQIVSSGYDGVLTWFDLRAKLVVRQTKAHPFWVWDLAKAAQAPVVASVSGQYLAGSYRYDPRPAEEPCVKVFNAVTGETLAAMECLPPVQAVALNAVGDKVAAGNLMGDLAVWRQTGERLSHARTKDFTAFGHIKSHCQVGGIYATAFDPRNEEVLAAGMGPMRDPMAGNGKQRWQRYDWRQGAEAKKIAASKDDQVGEGLMETLAFHPSGGYFVMAGRLRGGNWDVGFFDSESGDLVHSLKTQRRVTKAVFSDDGHKLYLGEAGKQDKNPSKHFGRIEVYSLAKS